MNVNLVVALKVKSGDLTFREEHITVNRLNPRALMYTPCNPRQLMNIKDFVFHVEVGENILKKFQLQTETLDINLVLPFEEIQCSTSKLEQKVLCSKKATGKLLMQTLC